MYEYELRQNNYYYSQQYAAALYMKFKLTLSKICQAL